MSAIVSAPTVGHISSGFGWRTLDGHADLHTGIDLVGAEGSPIYAVLDGLVLAVGNISGYGLAVVVRHPEHDLVSLYAHLDSARVRKGQHVSVGQRIAKMGGSGWRPDEPNRTVPIHLHFEFLDTWPPAGKDQNRLDPIAVFERLGLSLNDDQRTFAWTPPKADWVAYAMHRVLQPYPWG